MLNRKNLRKYISIITVILFFAGMGYLYFWGRRNGIWEHFDSAENLKAYVESFGGSAPWVFGILQFVQVIASPIPGNVTTVAGGILFGFWKTLWISSAAVTAGSILAFALARAFGRPLVEGLIGRHITNKYLKIILAKQKVALIIMFLMPFFPDDALCLIAGLSDIRWRFFILCVIITRIPGLAVAALVGAGAITMPLWGWLVIGAASLGIFLVAMKFSERFKKTVHIQ